MRRRAIAVVGAGAADAQTLAVAEAVGREIAGQGAVLVCGGLGGVMQAACKGATEAGGLTVGLLPGTAHSAANAHVDIAIPTGIGEARNLIVALSGDAVIAVGGALGTLSEIALALKNGRRVVGLGSWTLEPARAGGLEIIPAETPEQAVRLAIGLD